jgi:tRNA pseudouridine55 synthase
MRGVLNINKPSGISSYDVIRVIKNFIKQNSSKSKREKIMKIGHAGTLDPLANGVLLILFNEATKIASYLTEQKKEYLAEIKLGIKTDTDDISGKIIQEKAVPKFTPAQIEEVLQEFRGEITQIPPSYSALQQQGKRLYILARQGRPVEPKSRQFSP